MRHERGKRSAERRIQPWPLPRGSGSGSCGSRSPFGAPLRRLPERANAPAQSRPRFTRIRGCGRYPRHHSRLSQAPGAPVVMPAGHSSLGAQTASTACDARAARERSYKLRPQEPHPLHRRLSPATSLRESEIGRGYCHRGGKVKEFEFVSMNQRVSRRPSFLKGRTTRLILWCRLFAMTEPKRIFPRHGRACPGHPRLA